MPTVFAYATYWLLTIADCLSTNYNRARREARGLDPDLSEQNLAMRFVMRLAGDYWTVARMVGGVSLWCWLVLNRGATFWTGPMPGSDIVWFVLALDLFIAGVVYYNSRKRFGLWWPN